MHLHDGAGTLASVQCYWLPYETPSCGNVHVSINKAEVAMEVDTGTSASIISEETYNRLWSKDKALQLKQSDVKLRTYSGEQLTIKWSIDVTVQYNEQIS